MKKNKKVTMKMVAEQAGVSIQTVSRVVNQHPDVALITKEKVRGVMDRLHYTPNIMARSLSQQRSRMIGVVVESMQDVGPMRILAGIIYGADQENYCVLIKELKSFEKADIIHSLQALRSRQVDGIIWSISEIGNCSGFLREYCAEKMDIPMLFLTADKTDAPGTFYLENYSCAYAATKHLIEQGYQHIAHISGPETWLVARRRKQAWADALRDAGCPVEERACYEGTWWSESGRSGYQYLRRHYPEMDAVFASNDHMALSLIQTAQLDGLRVPQDLGVVGYDGILEAEYYDPPLSTVTQNFDRTGKLAVEQMIVKLENGNDEPVGLTGELVVRESSLRRGKENKRKNDLNH